MEGLSSRVFNRVGRFTRFWSGIFFGMVFCVGSCRAYKCKFMKLRGS